MAGGDLPAARAGREATGKVREAGPPPPIDVGDLADPRDLTLPQTVRDFVAVIDDQDLLAMLMLLTYADMQATGVLSPVRLRFLEELVRPRRGGAGRAGGADRTRSGCGATARGSRGSSAGTTSRPSRSASTARGCRSPTC